MKSKSYFFISHSSKDLDKVRKIRNLIEELDCNPILFYLKCLDNDDPTGQDEIELKSLLYREIAARNKVILCRSKHTEPPLETNWIAWEKKTIKELAHKLRNFVIDLDEPDYLETALKIILKFKNILIISTYDAQKNASELVTFLKSSLSPYNINISELYEDRDMITDMNHNFGAFTKDIIKDKIKRANLENKSLILFLSTDTSRDNNSTFMQIAYALSSHNNCFLISRKIKNDLSEEVKADILKQICDILFS